MLLNRSEVKSRDVKLSPKPIDIYFLGDEESLALELPSAEELSFIREGCELKVSCREISKCDYFNQQEHYQNEKSRLLEKYEKYKGSTSYLAYLSNLSELLGDNKEAYEYLKKAKEEDDTNYFNHEIGDNLIKHGLKDEAFELFSSLDVSTDSYANLRLAYFYAANKDIKAAEPFVLKALEIDECSYKARMFHGAICLWKRDFERAVRNYKIALEENPRSSVGFVNIAAAYWGMGLKSKAYSALKRAVILNPFNENAVNFFSDVSHIKGKDKDCVHILNNYLKYEHNSVNTWALLGRAYYTVGKEEKNKATLLEAMNSLRHQESLTSNSGVWNNMGLVAWELQNYDVARRYLNLSLKKAIEENDNSALPLYNICGLMIERSQFKDALSIIEASATIFATENENNDLIDKLLLQHVVLLEAVGKRYDAVNTSLDYLSRDLSNHEVKLDLLSRVVYYHTVFRPSIEIIEQYTPTILSIVDAANEVSNALKIRAINNLVFALLNFDKDDEANSLINRLSNSFHKDPFATATLGMYTIKKGQIDKGIALYEESISLLQDKKSKRRFRQRLNYELGKAHLRNGDKKLAFRFLNKAVHGKDGIQYVVQEINRLLKDNTLLILSKKAE